MRLPRKLFPLHCLGIVLLAWALNANADTTDISDTPMAVKNNVPPNFMYMIDNSGSMRHVVPEALYDVGTTYLSSCPTTMSGGKGTPAEAAQSNYAYYIVVLSTGTTKIKWVRGNSLGFYFYGTSSRCFDPALYYRAGIHGDLSASGSGACGDSGNCKVPAGVSTAIYKGNYLNWYFGQSPNYTTAASLDYSSGRKSGTQSRMEIAKTAAKSALDSLPLASATQAKVRVGLSTYNSGNGGALLEAMADLDSGKLSTVKAAVDDLTVGGETPLSETLADIGHYFSIPYTGNLTLHPESSLPPTALVANVFKQGNTSPHKLSGASSTCTGLGCPVQYWCQRSYAVLMTDGQSRNDLALNTNSYLCDYDGDFGACTTNGVNAYDRKNGRTYDSDGSDYLDDVAQALYEIDLRPDLVNPNGQAKTNNVRTYTIGFADDQVKNDPLMKETATQGGGLFLTADDTSTLTTAFKKVIDDALAKDSASAAVAVANTQLTVDNTAYASSYNSGYWVGDLQAHTIDTSTGIPNIAPIWSAQTKLDALSSPATSRKIVTFNGVSGVPFQPQDVTLTNSNNSQLIEYLRGSNANANGTLFRKRKNLLGDIVNAEPVVVKYADGIPIVFQAANDGMLHVFNGCGSPSSPCSTGAGQELWAYVPKMIWPSLTHTDGGLADPNYAHKYLVDATPAVADVTISGATTKLLIGGLGKGGKGYYALDVTSYSANSESAYASKVKWEFPASAPSVESSVGYSYGTPLIVKSPNGWVVLVPSGYNNSDGSGKLFALNPLTGAVMQTMNTGVGSAGNPAGLGHISRLSTAAATDVISHVYGGDLLGNVWRFDLTNWSATRIAVLKDGAGNTQPVSTAPAVGRVSGSSSKYFVYAGTGLYLGDSDIPDNTPVNDFATQTQSMYGIIDNTSVATPALPDIRATNGAVCPSNGGDGAFICQDQGSATDGSYTGTHHSLTTDHSGWYFDLPITNSRVVTHPQLTSGGALVFTINVPTNLVCDPGGSSWFVNVDASNGGAVETALGSDQYHPSIMHAGFALASRVVVVTTADGKYGIIRMADQTFGSRKIHEPPVPGPNPAGWRRIYWRELM